MIPWTVPLDGTIERRLLINYRLDPDVARALLPRPLRPQLVDGSAVAGVCLIRLGALRPAGLTARVGLRSENAAHRIAVEWDGDGGIRTGVYIPERHSASRLPVAVGGRLFPGVHRPARFDVSDRGAQCSVRMTAADASVGADIELTDEWSSTLFPTLDDASAFFRKDDVGWSPDRTGGALEGVRLGTRDWSVTAGRAIHVSSSVFDALPRGAAVLDDVLVMRDVPVRWTAPRHGAPGGTRTPNRLLRTQLLFH
ncbi:hypothetical protein ARHIZOSPH14_24110 [Agromyces rhizosphaerae]|uniref:DUF2071 domain-containing protein n=1 Tax=Agromyces rhizosphaerae TaxID=88374 RepID=A0A9W6FPM0_9MICO|nr:hypothetical protein ARHIZOSPH14_24110 [Agromyces rhizosphaerae]